MSHAAVLIALDPPVNEADVEQLVAEQMMPFDESGEWFRDGSRWDWYVIGGRFTGLLDGYDPDKDSANLKTCELCAGTGVRPDGEERFGSAWVVAVNGCNGCQGKGMTTKWPTEWARHAGDIMRVRDLDPTKLRAPSAFLRNQRWDEDARMGWFGMKTATECEVAGRHDLKRCFVRGKQTEAIVCSWNEPYEQWEMKFHDRFIRPLDPDTLLVVVDYHV